jgi:membrane-associated phospholipid phosphatase
MGATDWDHVGEAIVISAKELKTWIPIAGSIVVLAGGWDDDISDWAFENTPIYGSVDNAEIYADIFLTASIVSVPTTILVTPRPNGTPNKLALLGVSILAGFFTNQGVDLLKNINRERPDESDTESFPSRYTALSAVSTTMSIRNIEFTRIKRKYELPLDIFLYAITLGTGWARIEAGKSYPTDVLFALSLGNFLGCACYNTFFDHTNVESFNFVPIKNGVAMRMKIKF